jgi:hypothetical protein
MRFTSSSSYVYLSYVYVMLAEMVARETGFENITQSPFEPAQFLELIL